MIIKIVYKKTKKKNKLNQNRIRHIPRILITKYT